ncbi:MAG: Mu-like prophage major head subunit gpT family protein [Victivallaceae bacterium]|nr:Mu-like prophage major head subunit gpT family protein [Victivallaceae bacterium]
MDINRNTMSAVYTYYSLRFKNAFNKQAQKSRYEKFCIIDGDIASKIVQFPFLEAFAFMREWLGPRQVKNLASKKLIIIERGFEDTIGVPVRDIETDNWKQFGTIYAQMGQAGEKLWDRLAVAALTGAGNWIDDKAFFLSTASGSGARKYGKSVIVNKTTSALSADTFNAARTAMMSYQDHVGEDLGVIPDVLMVGPSLEDTAWDILVNDYAYDATDKVQIKNKNKGRAELVVNKRLVGDYANYWFLMDCSGEIKPVVLQQSKTAKLTRMDHETDANVFMNGEALYGTDAFGNAAAAFPHLVYGGIVSA